MNQTLEATPNERPKKNKNIYFFLGIIFVFLIIGVAIFALRLIKPSPQKVLSQMIEKTSDLNSFSFKANLELDDLLNVKYEGNVNASELKNIKYSGNMDLTFSYFFMELFVNLDMIFIDGESYIRINDAPEEGLFPFGEWVKSEAPITYPEEIILNEDTKGKNIFSFKEELKSKTINGVKTYHYIVNIDENEMTKLLDTFISESEDKLTEEQEEMIKNMVSWMAKLDIELFIGQKDYLLYGLKIDEKIDFSEITTEEMSEEFRNFGFNFKPFDFFFEIYLSDFRKSIDIEAPKDYIKESDLRPSFYNPYLEDPHMDYDFDFDYEFEFDNEMMKNNSVMGASMMNSLLNLFR